jgi:dienelactone hydrolase
MSIYLRVTFFGAAWLGFICLCAPMSKAQVARTELHAVPTLTQDFLTGQQKNGSSVTIAGALRIPRLGSDRLPVVILVHGSGGVGGNVDRWSQELNGVGLATFTLDSFTARGLQSTSANQALLGRLNMIFDSYRALAVLSTHPRIDPAKIVLMGFPRGGQATLYASLNRFPAHARP